MMSTITGKKLLVLGGTYQHRKIVMAAKNLGVKTFVTDYLDIQDSPAKQMADVPLNCNIFDVDGLVQICRQYHIDGAIGPYLDVSQMPYQEVCERMGFHCFGSREQHKILTDKALFKDFCTKHGADIIPSYSEQEILAGDSRIEWPVLIKPSDSRGSRGQSICFSRDEALSGIESARAESRSGSVIIEKYMGSENDIQLAYLVVDGEPLLLKVEDRYTGKTGSGLENLCIATITPSRHEGVFMQSADAKIRNMIKALNLKNAPVFIQAFMDGDKGRLYDPGLRMPGDDYDCGYMAVTGVSLPEMFVRFALTGSFYADDEPHRKITPCREKFIAMFLPCLKPGKIARLNGLDEVSAMPEIAAFTVSYKAGDAVGNFHDVRQRFGEFVAVSDDAKSLKKCAEILYTTLEVISDSGEDMLTAEFDVTELEKYIREAK